MNSIENYPLLPVPKNKRLPFLSIALVHMGMMTAIDQFVLGAVLGHALTLVDAFIVIFSGSLLFGLITFGLGYMGMKEGLSGSMLARWCGFGRIGSALIGIVVTISLLGWFGVQNAIFAKSLNYAFGNKLGFAWSAILSGSLLTILVAFGFKALLLAARIFVPLFIVLVGYISFDVLSGHSIGELALKPVSGEALTLSAGITIVVGGAIVASLMTPDLTRYAKNTKHVLGITLATIISGEFIINGLAILIARTLNTSDVVAIMSHSANTLGLLVIVFSTLRVNDLNLYSSSLGLINAINGLTGKTLKYRSITLFLGILGTSLSVLGILDRFVDFLTILGVVFPPILGIMLVDYYLLRTHRASLYKARQADILPNQTPVIGYSSLFACLVGSTVGLLTHWGIPAVNSLLVASLIHLALGKISRIRTNRN